MYAPSIVWVNKKRGDWGRGVMMSGGVRLVLNVLLNYKKNTTSRISLFNHWTRIEFHFEGRTNGFSISFFLFCGSPARLEFAGRVPKRRSVHHRSADRRSRTLASFASCRSKRISCVDATRDLAMPTGPLSFPLSFSFSFPNIRSRDRNDRGSRARRRTEW